MSTAALPANPVVPMLAVRRGWLEPYDAVLAGALLVAAVITAATGRPLLAPQAWLGPNILLSFGFLAGCFLLLFVARMANLRLRHHRLPGLTLRVAVARHFGLHTLGRALRFAVAFELVRLPATVLVQRIPALRALPHRPHLPQVFDEPVLGAQRLMHGGFDPQAALASVPWPAWFAEAMDYTAVAWLAVPGLVVAYALSCSHRLRTKRLLVSLPAVWMLCPLVALALPTTGPFLVQQGAYPAAGMHITDAAQFHRFIHWNMELFPQRGGAVHFGYGLMGLPCLPAAALVVCLLFTRQTAAMVFRATLAMSLVVLLAMLLAGWHYLIGIYAAAALAAAVWWASGVFLKRIGHGREYRPDDALALPNG